MVVVYRERELIFDIVEKENGSVFRTWQEKRLADRLFQAEKGTLVGMNYDVEKNEHRLWKYNLISRHSSYVALNREYYGWFHNVLGVDNVRHELILTSGKDLARYSLSDMTLNPFGFYGQLDSPEKENIPDVSVWKIDVKGEVYIPIATEAGLSFINVTL